MVSSVDDGIGFAEKVSAGAVLVVVDVGLEGCGSCLVMLRAQDSIDDTRPGAR